MQQPDLICDAPAADPRITALSCVGMSLYEERKSLSLYESWIADGTGGTSIQHAADAVRARIAKLEAAHRWLQLLEV